MKAIITNRIYLDANDDLISRLSTELTYKIPAPIKGKPPEIIKTFSRISKNACSIPVGRTDLIPSGYEIIDRRVLVPVEFPEFKATLRDSQFAVYDELNDNAIINAQPSWGKTFTGIAIATKLGQKTLVVCHTTLLRDQWVEEVKKTLGFYPSIIGSGKFETETPIVIANVQTLTKHIDKVSSMFGTLILDEAHHVPASTFSSIIDRSKARYKIGLSGTLERKDRKHVIFTDYFGNKIFKPEKENFYQPHVLLVDSNTIFPGGKFWANRVTELEVHNKDYQKLVAELADAAARKGHKVLIVGNRVEFLKACAELSKEPAIAITGEIKDLKQRLAILDLIGTGEISIIYGTMSIFSEGISQNDLSCLIIATPLNNDSLLKQLVGRICRLKEGKLQPLIIDIQLLGTSVKVQQRNRVTHYLKEGYTIRKLKK
jgi:superfamily II DNA or RNA helicase